MIDSNSIAIAITTLYSTWYQGPTLDISHTEKVRGDLALQTIDLAIEKGYQVFVSDSTSSEEFKEELRKRKIDFSKRIVTNRAEGKRDLFATISKITEIKVIFWTVPEKTPLVDFIPQIVEPILNGSVPMVSPKRDPKLFKESYPPYMYDSEIKANKAYNKELSTFGILPKQQEFDFYFGPVAFENDPEITSLFLEEMQISEKLTKDVRIDLENASNSLLFPVVKALYLGLKIETVTVPFVYPKIQKENELINEEHFREKRKWQKDSFLTELKLYLDYLKSPDDPKNLLIRAQ